MCSRYAYLIRPDSVRFAVLRLRLRWRLWLPSTSDSWWIHFQSNFVVKFRNGDAKKTRDLCASVTSFNTLSHWQCFASTFTSKSEHEIHNLPSHENSTRFIASTICELKGTILFSLLSITDQHNICTMKNTHHIQKRPLPVSCIVSTRLVFNLNM